MRRATYTGLSHWLTHRTGITSERADALAAVGLGALFSARLLRLLIGRDAITIPDETFIATWVQTLYDQIKSNPD